MNLAIKGILVATIAAFLYGCAASMVPETSDPAKKLGWARVLIEEQNRPLPAERLIREAIEIYRASSDQDGLAEGYRRYGLFFASPSVKKFESHYRTEGFLDKTVTFDKRMDKAIEYFNMSKEQYEKTKAYDRLSNIYLLLAWANQEKGEHALACRALDASLASNAKLKAEEPSSKVSLSGPAKSFDEVIAKNKEQMHCK
jgi:tetratricopeptide (TPR) repeat protein